MKTAGLIGGMSWESTATYYTLINQGVNAALGKNHSAKILMHSFDFQEIEELQYAGDWTALKERILDAGARLKHAGADFAVLCTNTMHKVVGSFENEVGIPLIHIADAVGESARNRRLESVGLLGTIFTMEQNFYKDVLESRHHLKVIVPKKSDREVINTVIYEELVKGIVRERSRIEYMRIMDELLDQGVQAIVLGCTEIGLLIKEYKAPLLDSTILHADKVVLEMLNGR